jgi:hypothetical protein
MVVSQTKGNLKQTHGTRRKGEEVYFDWIVAGTKLFFSLESNWQSLISIMMAPYFSFDPEAMSFITVLQSDAT